MKKYTRYITALALACSLAACGGGGGGTVVGGDSPGGGIGTPGGGGSGTPDPRPGPGNPGGGGGVPAIPGWQVAKLLETTDAQASQVDVSINSAGVGYAVWQQVNGDEREVFASRYTDGKWELVQSVTGSDAGASNPQVAVLDDGEAVAVWRQPSGFFEEAVYFNRTVNKVWQVAKELHLAGGEVSNLELVADAQGKALAVWQHDQALLASAYSAGSFDQVPKQISKGTNSKATAPSVAMIASGDALVAWQEEVFPGQIDIVVRPYLGGDWKRESLLTDNTTANATNPSVAFREASQGVGTSALTPQAFVVWEQLVNLDIAIIGRGTGSIQQGDWGPFNDVANDDDGGTSEPRVAIDPLGNITFTWLQQDRGQPSVSLWARRGAGTRVKIESHDGQVTSPALGVDAQERALVIWTQDLGAGTSMSSNRFDPTTGEWGEPELIGSGLRAAEVLPVLAMNSNGRAIAGWEMNPPLPADAGGRNVMANVYNEPPSP
jgi:hypothetical protein